MITTTYGGKVYADAVTGQEYDVRQPAPLQITLRLPWRRWNVSDDYGRNHRAFTFARALAKTRKANA